MDIVKKQLSMRDDPIYVIPCSHEISSKKPPCDGSGSKAGLSSRGENEGASNDYLNDPNLNLDTSMYNEFYNRIRRDHNRDRKHCVDTTMFKQIIEMVQKKDEGDLRSQPREEEDGDLGSQPPEEEDGDLGSQPPENEPVTLG